MICDLLVFIEMRVNLRSRLLGVRLGYLLLLLLAFSLASGCDDNPANPGEMPKPVARIEVRTTRSELWLTDREQLYALLYSYDGTRLENRPVIWESDNTQIASVTDGGMVEALAAGNVIITASAENVSATAAFQVFTYELIYEVSINNAPTLYSLSLDLAATPQQLDGLEPFAYEPAASPDGNYLVYVSLVDNYNPELFLYGLRDQTSKRLTYDEDMDDMASWDPGGSRIAFRSNMAGKISDIVLYDLSDQSLTNITPDPPGIGIEERQPAWSPDGRKIAYSSTAGGNMDLWLMDSVGSDKIRLTSTDDYDTESVWSPDGRYILFRRWSDTGMALMLYEVETGLVTELELAGHQRMPAWSPDGRWIAFVSQPTLQDRPEIFMMRPDGSELRQVTREWSWGGGQNPTFRKTQ